MQVGDLVQLKKHCLNSDRWAIITALPSYLSSLYTIIYLDTQDEVQAIGANLEVHNNAN
jgi:hypothetical protein